MTKREKQRERIAGDDISPIFRGFWEQRDSRSVVSPQRILSRQTNLNKFIKIDCVCNNLIAALVMSARSGDTIIEILSGER